MKDVLIEFPTISDQRGFLVALEQSKDIPFDIKRVYYIYNTKTNEARGFHAHIDLKQVLICVSGTCSVILDNGREKNKFTLNKPNQGLFIEGLIWREMHDFSDNCVLVVLASDYYDEKDYIRDYHDFLIAVEEKEVKLW